MEKVKNPLFFTEPFRHPLTFTSHALWDSLEKQRSGVPGETISLSVFVCSQHTAALHRHRVSSFLVDREIHVRPL